MPNLGLLPRFGLQMLIVAALTLAGAAGFLLLQNQLSLAHFVDTATNAGLLVAGLGASFVIRPRSTPGALTEPATLSDQPQPNLMLTVAAGGALVLVGGLIARYVFHLA